MIVRKTAPEEGDRVNELFSIAFEQPPDNGPADPRNDRIAHWAAFSERGEMMSTLSVSDFDISFDGNVCKMGGVGGVATLPQYRRRGGIRACFAAALPELHSDGYDFSYLYPFSTAYYRRFGYESCVQKYICTVDLTLLPAPGVKGSFRLAEPGTSLRESIRAVDRVWERQYNMAVRHGPGDYGWTEKCEPVHTLEYTCVWLDPGDAPKAYTTFRTENQPDGRNLVCKRFCFADREGFLGLMQIFKSLAADHRYVKFDLPAEPSLQYLLPEWSLGAATWALRPAGMARVLNVKSVLEKARYRGSGSAVLNIRDPIIYENDGRFSVTFAEGMAVSAEPTGAPADASLSVAAFSALIAGVCDFVQAADRMPGVMGRYRSSSSQIAAGATMESSASVFLFLANQLGVSVLSSPDLLCFSLMLFPPISSDDSISGTLPKKES